jgi:hypothetical protein
MALFDDILGNLATAPIGESKRISSNEQPNWNDGNMDFTSLLPGATLEMPLLEGPGVITHVWMTSHAGLIEDLNCLSLRIYYDGRDAPGVESPLGTFFAVSGSRLAAVNSFPVVVSESGSLTCYWRMPFAKTCRIAVTNDHPTRMIGLYWQVDWTSLPSLPPDTLYFHAKYRQEHPAAKGSDYLVFEGRGRGRYVGTVMEVTLAQDGWFGEGDDYFYIDGEKVPSLQGTGSEDYFNDAWGLRHRSTDWFGAPLVEGYTAGDSLLCYRWHAPDPVHFHRSLRVTMEHKGNGTESTDFWYLERPDFISTVALWYQLGEPSPFGSLPPYRERRPPWRETSMLAARRSIRVDDPASIGVDMQGLFGIRPSVRWTSPPGGARLVVPFAVDRGCDRCAVRVVAHAGPRMGVFDVSVDGREAARGVDLREAEDGSRTIALGVHALNDGAHELAFVSQGTGDLSVESLRVLPLPPAAALPVKRPGHEGHFVRLAIGRAVYVHRMVEGGLPASLEALVSARYLEERFLRDENGRPLAGGVCDDRFVVTATAWRGAWEGVDPRR